MTLHSQTVEKMRMQMISVLEENDGRMGNISLRELLKDRDSRWTEDLYWQIRSYWIDGGKLITGKGKGGTVALVAEEQEAQAFKEGSELNADENCYSQELELYQPVSVCLNSTWTQVQGYCNYITEVCANKGSANTGGKWTRPDIVVIGVKAFPFIPNKYLDVTTFEVKKAGCWDVTSVYEALAHRRRSTQAYIWLYAPEQFDEEKITPVRDAAKQHGIGIMIGSNPSDFSTWEILVDAVRVTPDPYNLNEFIAQCVSDERKELLTKYIR